MAKMWQGRFEAGLNSRFEEWQKSFDFDQRLLPQEIASSRAYARALARAGVLTSSELSTLEHALTEIGVTARPPLEDAEAEDVHHYLEMMLTAAAGEVALKLHVGRSRNEQIATALRLYLRAHTEQVSALLLDLCHALLSQASQAGDAAMPAYTHVQKAEPVLVGHLLLAYFEMFRRDISRLEDCSGRMNVCPLGSGPIAGSTVPLDRDFIAAELGFRLPSANSVDATGDRDFVAEYVHALTMIGVHIGQLSEQFTIFASHEFGFVTLPDSHSTGSSAMPQKKNPDAFELLRAKSARLSGCSVGILGILKGLPSGYNKDLQEIQPMLFAACDIVRDGLEVLSSVVLGLRLNVERMRVAATTGNMNALAAATYLTSKGVPFRRAHEQVGAIVRECLKRGCEIEDLTLEELKKLAPMVEADIYDALRLEAVLDCHDVLGGTARARVKQALIEAKEWFESKTKITESSNART